MYKFFKKIFIIFIFPLLIMGCNKNFTESIKSPLRISKPSLNLYTENLIRSIKNTENLQISIFYPKIGKNKTIPNNYMEKFNLFIESIKPNYFIDPKKQNINLQNPEYRLTIFINNSPTFILNIFDAKYITINPWDGTYEPDIIDISNLHTGINIYNIVDFIMKN